MIHRLVLVAVAVAIVVAGAAIETSALTQTAPPSPPAAQHLHWRIPDADILHRASGPYVAQAVATDAALRAGSPGDITAGPRTVVSAALLTVRDATANLEGISRPVSDGVAEDREVWLVKVHGPYTAPFTPYGTTVHSDDYYVIVDAESGRVFGTGTGSSQSRW